LEGNRSRRDKSCNFKILNVAVDKVAIIETRIAENGSNYARKKVHYLDNLRDDVITLIQNFDL